MIQLAIESTTDELAFADLQSRTDPVGSPPEWTVSTGRRIDPGAVWQPGSWSGVWAVRTGRVRALSPAMGAGQALDTPTGRYLLWVRWADGSERPVKLVGELIVR